MEKKEKEKEKDYLQAKGFRAFFCHTQPRNQHYPYVFSPVSRQKLLLSL